MKTTTGLAIAMLLVIGAQAAFAETVTLDFDGLAFHSFVDDAYRGFGAVFSPGVQVRDYTEPGFGPEIASPPHFVAVAEAPIRIDFVQPGTAVPATTDAVSLWMSDADTNTVLGVLAAYDSGGGFLDTDLRATTSSVHEAVLSVSAPNISYVLIYADSDGAKVDDVSFTRPVPEPLTAAALGLGVLALGRRGRSK